MGQAVPGVSLLELVSDALYPQASPDFCPHQGAQISGNPIMGVDVIPRGLSHWQPFEIGTSTGTLSDSIGYLLQKPSLGFSLQLGL